VSGAPTRVFIARLAGTAVLDPSGDRVGRLRDVVVTLRTDRQPPRVLGMTVEVQPRRQVFVPMGRVTSIDADAVIITGTVNMRRFEQRSSETMVLTELLDRQVRAGEAAGTIVDVAMEQQRSRDWLLTRVALKTGTTGIRRRGQVTTFDWDQVDGLRLDSGDAQGAESLLQTFEDLNPADLAHVMHEMPAKRRAEVARQLDDERLADVLEELPEDEQVEIIIELESERAADVLEAMGPDDAADLLAEMTEADAQRLLELMEPEEAAPVRRLLIYSEDTAGGLMTSEPVVLAPDATVAEALARVRDPQVTPALAAQVYVCRPPTSTPTGKYLGMAHIQRLLREAPATLVSAMLDTDIEPLSPDVSLAAVTSYLATYNLVAVPVVDADDHLLGAVSVDDVLDHLLPEDWRDRAPTEEAHHSETGQSRGH
jgi:flagellar motility protein MotE (MotC chaperone)/sporulation protein YlmC with PRC-barrel domain